MRQCKDAATRSVVRRTDWGRRLAVALGCGLSVALVHAEGVESSDVGFRAGSGLHVPSLGVSLGGYTGATYERLRGQPGRFALDDLSMMLWWEGTGRWKLFSEFDYENSVSSTARPSIHGDVDRRYLSLERLYADYAVGETSTLRGGKFLTPIGRWNLTHAAPLVWTSSRPLVTSNPFPTNITGVMFSNTVQAAGMGFESSLYAAGGDGIRQDPSAVGLRRGVGGRVVVSQPGQARLGVSVASFNLSDEPSDRKSLLGADLFWSRHRWELSAESVYRRSSVAGQRDEGGAFVQVVAPLSTNLYAIARWEIYRQALQQGPMTQLWVAGVNYRLTSALVLKAEWAAATHNAVNAPEGFLSSVSVLF